MKKLRKSINNPTPKKAQVSKQAQIEINIENFRRFPDQFYKPKYVEHESLKANLQTEFDKEFKSVQNRLFDRYKLRTNQKINDSSEFYNSTQSIPDINEISKSFYAKTPMARSIHLRVFKSTNFGKTSDSQPSTDRLLKGKLGPASVMLSYDASAQNIQPENLINITESNMMVKDASILNI